MNQYLKLFGAMCVGTAISTAVHSCQDKMVSRAQLFEDCEAAYNQGQDRALMLMQENILSLETIVVETGATLSNCNITILSLGGKSSGITIESTMAGTCYMDEWNWPMTSITHCLFESLGSFNRELDLIETE